MFHIVCTVFFCSTHPVTNNNGPVVNTILFNLWLNYTRVLRRVRQVSVLLRPSYRYRRSNCKYTINQPMIELYPVLPRLQRVLMLLWTIVR